MSSNRRIIFWYWVPCFLASFLKKSTLALLKAIVTFTLSWLDASSWGGGKKSSIIRSLPRGSFVYFIFSFIDCLSPSPITGTKDPDYVLAVSEPYCHDAAARFSKTVIALLRFTMLKVFRDNAARIRKCQLRKLERNAMLRLVLTILCLIPLEASRHNDAIKGYIQKYGL